MINKDLKELIRTDYITEREGLKRWQGKGKIETEISISKVYATLLIKEQMSEILKSCTNKRLFEQATNRATMQI